MDDGNGEKAVLVNIICWGTLYQQCIIAPDKTAATISRIIAEHWVRYFGPPLVLISDPGPEFIGKDFKDWCDSASILLHVNDTEAPWQNVRTERHGNIFKKIMLKAI